MISFLVCLTKIIYAIIVCLMSSHLVEEYVSNVIASVQAAIELHNNELSTIQKLNERAVKQHRPILTALQESENS